MSEKLYFAKYSSLGRDGFGDRRDAGDYFCCWAYLPFLYNETDIWYGTGEIGKKSQPVIQIAICILRWIVEYLQRGLWQEILNMTPSWKNTKRKARNNAPPYDEY